MKKLILFSLIAIVLASCEGIPQQKYDIAKSCIDSLKKTSAGFSKSYALAELEDNLNYVNGQITVEKSKLFKKCDDINKGLDLIILEARSFDASADKIIPESIIPDNINIESNEIKLEIVLTFDSKQDALKIASDVDDVVRRSSNAKLINVKIIQ